MHSTIVKRVRDILMELDLVQGKPERYYDAGKIVKVITDTITEGVKRDGFVTIEGLGRFYKKTRAARTYSHYTVGPNGKRLYDVPQIRVMRKERVELGFQTCKAINRSLRDKEDASDIQQ